MFIKSKLKIFAVYGILIFLAGSDIAHAAGDLTRHEYFQFRKSLSTSQEKLQSLEKNKFKEIKLITSQGYDQYASSLCWFYAAINAIEVNYTEISGDYTNIPLSRAYIQRLTWEDRYKRLILKNEDYLKEGGTVVDAISLINNQDELLKSSGIYYINDFEVMPRNYTLRKLKAPYTLERLQEWLDVQFQTLPKSAVDPVTGVSINPAELAKKILGSEKWTAYGRNLKGQPVGSTLPHWDPDARKDTLATYVSDEDIGKIIFKSLSSGRALTVSWPKHEEMIYGAKFDNNNRPLSLFILGSYGPDYRYEILYEDAFKKLMGVTTVVGPE